MAAELNEDEFPSIDRIPTARDFRSFDSSSDDDTAMAHRYEVDESKLMETDSYDFDGVVGVASEGSSAAPSTALSWGESRDEDEYCDWVADSFDHYDQRQLGANKLKAKFKTWQKRKYLADEEEDFIAESRVKQSVRMNLPKIYSPPSMKDYSYDDDEDRISAVDTRKKEISEKIAAIAKRVHQKEHAQDHESTSAANDRNPSCGRRTKARSARKRSPSPPVDDTPLERKSLINESHSESTRSASPVRKVAVQPNDSTEPSSTSEPSELNEPSVASEPVDPKESLSLSDPAPPSSVSTVSNLSHSNEVVYHAPSEDGDQARSMRSSKVGKLLSVPFKSKSLRKEEVAEKQETNSPPSKVSRGTSTVKETIDMPTAQVVPKIPMMDVATNTSLPISPSSVSSFSGRQKSSRKSSFFKSFSFHGSSKDDGDMQESTQSMKTSSTQAEDESSVRERNVPGIDSKQDCKGIDSSDHVATDTTKEKEKTGDNDKAERKKKAARLIRSYIKSGKVKSKRGNIDEKESEAGTASTTKRSTDMSQITATVAKIEDKEVADDKESQSKEPNTTVGTTCTSKSEKGKPDNVEAIQAVANETKEAEKEPETPQEEEPKPCKETKEQMSDNIFGMLFGGPDVNDDNDVRVNEVDNKTETIPLFETPNDSPKDEVVKEELILEEKKMSDNILGMPFGGPDVNDEKDVRVNEVDNKTETIPLFETPNDSPKDEVVKEELILEEKTPSKEEANLDDKKKKSTKSRSLFGKILGKHTKDENKEASTGNADIKSEPAPVESITIPLQKTEDVPIEENKPENGGKEKTSEANNDIADVTDKNAAPSKKDSAVVAEQSLFDIGLDTKDIEEFLRENYCGPVADCLGLTQFAGDKESIGATNAAVNPRKLKLDGDDVDIDQAVAAMRRSKHMAKLPVKSVDVPQDFIFPSTSSITDSQAAYKEGIKESNKSRSKTVKDEADQQRKVKNFLHKMGARRSVNR
jgi:hypothetical protein